MLQPRRQRVLILRKYDLLLLFHERFYEQRDLFKQIVVVVAVKTVEEKQKPVEGAAARDAAKRDKPDRERFPVMRTAEPADASVRRAPPRKISFR